jgi:carboxylesterase
MNDRIVPGAEAFAFEGGPIGVLMLHGFTANPAGLRPVGEWLAARGHAVSCPLLPGHGTRWQDLETVTWQQWVAEAERALRELAGRTDAIIALGMSLGGAMAFHLAVRHPDLISGVVAVNPYVRDSRIAAAAIIRLARRTVKGIGNDIKLQGKDELPYDRIPLRGLVQLNRFLHMVQKELPRMRLPLLVFNSSDDHVVPRGTARWLMERVGSEDKELVELPNSYHVAWLDNDAELIFERTHEFAEVKAASRA